AEVHLPGMAGQSKHEDIGTRAEDSILEARNHDGTHLRMLETDALDGVVELDVNAQVVRIELEFVALEDSAIFRDIHRQRRNRPGKAQTPMPVLRWRSAVIDNDGASHFPALTRMCLCIILHQVANMKGIMLH